MRSFHGASSSLKAFASESIGRRWMHFASELAGVAPSRWVGLSECAARDKPIIDRLELAEEAVVLSVRDFGRIAA